MLSEGEINAPKCNANGGDMALSQSAETRKAIGRVQRLCCLGLGGQHLMPALIAALNQIVPSSTRQFYWADLRLEITNCYVEMSRIEFLPIYLTEFYGRHIEREVRLTFPEMMRTRFPTAVGDIFSRFFIVDWNTFQRSDYYNMLRRPCSMETGLLFKVTEAGRPVGAFHFFRSADEPAFAAQDYALLETLHGFIAHGLVDGPAEDSYDDIEDRALVILDRDGRLLHLSADAHRLLLMALVPRWAPQTACRMRHDNPPELAQLCHALSAAFCGGLPGAPPVLRRNNAWGEFVLRAYWLDASHADEPSPLIGVTIERREPRSLGLWRRVETLPLSQREKQVCMLLARGHDAANVARAMGVSEHTVISHRRNLYNKLGVENRLGLIERLRFG
jgi:DNA-binding CsgD family transcriptional regulator